MKAEKKIAKWAEQAIKQSSVLEVQKNLVKKQIFADPNVLNEITNHAVEELCNRVVYDKRSALKNSLNTKCIQFENRKYPNQSKITPEIMKISRTILDDYFCGDKCLGDCTFAEVREEALDTQKKGVGMIIQSRIFFAIAKLGKGKEIVRNKLKPQKVIQIINKEKTSGKKIS